MRQRNNYNLLLDKLDQFIRKYYINKLIKGFLYTTGIIVLAYTAFVLLESYMYFSTSVRKAILASFSIISAGSLIYWVGSPILSYFKLGNQISAKQAATIIGDHFADVKDKLLNVLQLQDQAGQNVQQAELINASIEQKSRELSPIQFQNAIDYNSNRKYLKYALPPVLLLLTLLVAAPTLISDGTKRLINANEQYEREAPFKFMLINDKLETPQFEDFTLQMSVEGDVLPTEVYIDVNGFRYLLSQNREGNYSYTFKNVKESVDFKFTASGFDSRLYSLNIKERALLNDFQVNIKYPAYTGIKSETLNNVGDLIVPKGTTIEWMMNTINTDFISLGFADETLEAERKGKGYFTVSKRALATTPYQIYIGNKLLSTPDTTSYDIQVVEDRHPSIEVKDFPDSTDQFQKYFAGEVADDYGLNALLFKYAIKDEKGGIRKEDKITVFINKGRSSDFTYQIDLRTLDILPGENVEYYFEVFDNDGINGSKSTRSALMNTKKESVKELKDQRKENKEEIENKLSQSSKESKDIQQKIQDLKESLLQKKEIDWQSRKELENLMKMQEELLEKMKETKDKFKENQENRKETEDENESMKEKEEKLEELFNEIEDNKANELMEKIQEMMQKLDREQTISTLDEMKKNNEIMQKNMERLEELYKNLEVEYEMQEMSKDLEELAEKQEALAEETEKGEKSSEELAKDQEELNKEMEDLQKKMDEINKKNEELQRPKDTEGGEDSMDDAKDEMDKAEEDLKKDDKKGAQKKQKKAAEKMKDGAKKMKEGMQDSNMEAMQEDLESLRQLLENLLNVSFSQEELIRNFASTAINTPKYVSLVQEQFRIKDNFRLVEDSLFALSKRVVQLEAVVLEKSAEIKYNLEKSVHHLEERQVSSANNTQQRTMTYANDLALLFNEAMENLQQDMSNSMPGTQMCNKPKPGQGEGGKMPLDKISEGQGKLTEEMKKMSEKMKEQGKEGGEGISAQEMAEMMQRQAQLRQALEKLSQEQRSKGQGSKLLQEIIDNMDKTEYELANKRLTNETLKRQEDIKIKLLEADRAEREQEFEEKRRAEVAKQQTPPKMPKELEEYLKQKSNSINEYRTVSPELNSYYRNLVENYMNSLKTN